jgi:hypothetical protein
MLMGQSLPPAERTATQLPPRYFGVGNLARTISLILNLSEPNPEPNPKGDDAFVNSDTLLTPWAGRAGVLENFKIVLTSICLP